MHALDVFAHGPVDRLAVTDVGDVDHDLHQMLHRAAGFLDQLLDVLHHLVGLLGGIVALEVGSVVEVLRALAAQPYGPAATRHHRLTEIVVQLLLGIGVLRIEFANPLMRHLASSATELMAATFSSLPDYSVGSHRSKKSVCVCIEKAVRDGRECGDLPDFRLEAPAALSAFAEQLSVEGEVGYASRLAARRLIGNRDLQYRGGIWRNTQSVSRCARGEAVLEAV